MKYIVKKLLKETYEYQILNDICNTMSTGDNKNSPDYMNYLKNFINHSEVLPEHIKEKSNRIFSDWENDMYYGVQNGRTQNSGTGDSESDESNTYYKPLQDLICGGFLEELD